MVRGALPDVPPHTATVMVDALDALSRALLVDVLGLSPAAALDLLDYLWRWDR